MRNSRIAYPSGGRFLQIQDCMVQAVGKAAAAVVADLDFLDRTQEQAGCILASRARLIADLEGFVGRDSVDNALELLIDLGWVLRHEQRVMGARNLQTSYLYSLDAAAISEFLADSRRPENRMPEKLKTGAPEAVNQNGDPTGNPDPSIDVLDLDLAVAAATADNWLNSSTHPLTAAALVKIATTTWRAKLDSNLELDKKHCRQALHVAATLSDPAAAVVVNHVTDCGGWPKDALAKLKEAVAQHRRDLEYLTQQAARQPKDEPTAAAKDERYACLIGRYVDLPSGRTKIRASGLLCAKEVMSLPQLLEEINAGRLKLCDQK